MVRAKAKGRRRAREAALQALYELDQSDHPLEDVLRHRVARFLHEAARRAAPELSAKAADRIVAAVGDENDLDAGRLAGELRLDAELVARAADAVARARADAGYVEAIVRGVVANRGALDEVVGRIAPEWPVEQMAPVDRNVLRISLWELARGTSPERVAINEAVELARTFSGEGARRMVNGALGAYVSGDGQLELPVDGGAA